MMSELLLGLLLFLGIHSLSIINEPWRDRMADRFGEWGWKGFYALISIIGFMLIIRGYGIVRLDSIQLYDPPLWLQHISLLLLLPVFPLLIAAYFPGRIKKAVHHPMLMATFIWATAHLFANGDLADLLLFGSFLTWTILDLVSMKHREQRPIPGSPPSKYNDLIALGLGTALYVLFLFGLHELLVGAPLI